MARPPASRETPLAQWLEAALQSRGWTQRRLAEESTISQPRITQILKGGTPRRDALESLAKALFPGNWKDEPERFANFYSEAIRATWPAASDYDAQVKAALPIAEAVWRLQGKDRRIVEELIGPIDPGMQTSRELIFDDTRYALAGETNNISQKRVDETKALAQRLANEPPLTLSPRTPQDEAIRLIKGFYKGKGDRVFRELQNFRRSSNPALPHLAQVQSEYHDGAIGEDFFEVNVETGDIELMDLD